MGGLGRDDSLDALIVSGKAEFLAHLAGAIHLASAVL